VDALHLIGGSPQPQPELVSLDELPDSVLHVLRELQHIRVTHLGKLSPIERRKLAAAEALIARYTDLQAQIDANGYHRD